MLAEEKGKLAKRERIVTKTGPCEGASIAGMASNRDETGVRSKKHKTGGGTLLELRKKGTRSKGLHSQIVEVSRTEKAQKRTRGSARPETRSREKR